MGNCNYMFEYNIFGYCFQVSLGRQVLFYTIQRILVDFQIRIREQAKAHKLDRLCIFTQEFNDRLYCQRSGLLNRVAVNACANRWKRY